MLLDGLPPAPPDPLIGLSALFEADGAPDKVDLGIGVYKDESGQAPVLGCVKQAERWLLQTQATKSYLSPAGEPDFNDAIQTLLFGSDSAAVKDGRVRTIQTPGASGALRIAAELIQRSRPGGRIWIPNPTWANHLPILSAGGLSVREYRYYDVKSHRLQFDEMMNDLAAVAANDVVLLHGCCHNPSGADLDSEQWQQMADLLTRTGAVPFVDIAYQGFAEGVEEDALPIRRMSEALPEMLVATSCSKSFALYRERTGAISIVGRNREDANTGHGHLLQLVRTMYSMPPDHGAAIVARVLGSPELRQQWHRELADMRERIRSIRSRFAELLSARAPGDFSYLSGQRGMFSFIDISPAEVSRLRTEFHVHLVDSGRINLAALSAANLTRVAGAIGAVLRAKRNAA